MVELVAGTFAVGGKTYRCERMSAFDQFDAARLMGDVFAALALVEDAARKEKKPPPGARAFTQLMAAASGRMGRESSEAALALCLSGVERQDPSGSWSRLAVSGSRTLMFNDVQLPQLLEIVWHVAKQNGLVDFFSAGPSTSEEPGSTTGPDGRSSRAGATG